MHRSSEEKDEYADQIQSVVTSLLDDVAPLRYVRRRPRKATTYWLSEDAVKAKRHRRRLERQWKKSGLESDRVAYRKSCLLYTSDAADE